MMRKFATVLILVGAMISPAFAAPKAAGDQTAQAKGFIDNLGSKALNTIKATQSGQLSQDTAKQEFRTLLNQSFDIPTIARFTLGRYWRVATPAQQTEFTGLVKETIIDKYADRVLTASTGSYDIASASAINDTDYAVMMNIKPTSGAPIAFAWRVRNIGGALKVIDLAVEGISMSVTNRSDFTSVIERNGGSVQALIDALKAKR